MLSAWRAGDPCGGVPRVVRLMMGVWFLASAFGETTAGRLGTLAAMPEDTGVPDALVVYGDLFWTLT
jgi:POT family proton-dependent oligopeptide transporter